MMDSPTSLQTHMEHCSLAPYRDLYMKYLGVLGLLGDAGAFADNNDEGRDLHERMTRAMADAATTYPISARRVLSRFDVEPDYALIERNLPLAMRLRQGWKPKAVWDHTPSAGNDLQWTWQVTPKISAHVAGNERDGLFSHRVNYFGQMNHRSFDEAADAAIAQVCEMIEQITNNLVDATEAVADLATLATDRTMPVRVVTERTAHDTQNNAPKRGDL